jgi:predicted glycosyltransferase
MKIWFDLSNSPHIAMFYDMIRDLENEGNEVIITCRPLANTIDLLNQKKLKYTVVGEHYGKNFYKKLFGYPIRVMQLRKFLAKHKPDVAVSQSSFHSPVVARLLGIPSIYTNDNEHAMGNMPSFYFATQVLIPENLPIDNVVKKGASRKRVLHYPGVKEGIYLWKKGEEIHQKRELRNGSQVKIFVRPEPLTAQYYKGGLNFLDDTLIELQDKVSITILPRDATQSAHYKQPKFAGIQVPAKPLEFDQIAEECTLFIGAGGSMTRELAILGIPTISVYQDELLEVDKFLLEKGLMKHEKALTAQTVINHLNALKDAKPDLELMQKGKQAYQFFKSNIYKYKN